MQKHKLNKHLGAYTIFLQVLEAWMPERRLHGRIHAVLKKIVYVSRCGSEIKKQDQEAKSRTKRAYSPISSIVILSGNTTLTTHPDPGATSKISPLLDFKLSKVK